MLRARRTSTASMFLLSLDARYCRSLKRIESSFQNPNICLNFAHCSNLDQKARKLIQTSPCKYAILPGKKVHEHFTHQATSGSLTINLSPRPLPSSLRFKACILLSQDNINLEDHSDDIDDDEKYESPLTGVSCHFSGKQNGLTVGWGSNQLHHMPCLYPHNLHIFEDSICLNQDYPEAEETTFIELSFVFIFHYKALKTKNVWKVKKCGVRLLEEVVPHCILDKKEIEDENVWA